MTSNRHLVQYKHDVIGKFKEITSVISPLDDFKECPTEYFELFSIVHELLIKMIATSRMTISEVFSQKARLEVVDEVPKKLKKVSVGDLDLFIDKSSSGLTYYYLVNDGEYKNIIFSLGKLVALLPTNKITVNIKDSELKAKLTLLLSFHQRSK